MPIEMSILFGPLIKGFKIIGHDPEAISHNRRFSKATICFFIFGTYLFLIHVYQVVSSTKYLNYRKILLIHGPLECLSYLSIVYNLKGMVNIIKKLEILRGKQEYKVDLKIPSQRLLWFSIFNALLIAITIVGTWQLDMRNDSLKSFATTYFYYTGEMTRSVCFITKAMMISIFFVSQVIPAFTLLFHIAICIVIKSVCQGFMRSLKGEKDFKDLTKLHAFYKDLIRIVADYDNKMNFTMLLMYIGLCLKFLRSLEGLHFALNGDSMLENGSLFLSATTSLFAIIFPTSEVHKDLSKIIKSVDFMKFRDVSFQDKCLFILKMQNHTASLTIWNLYKIDIGLLLKALGIMTSFAVIFYQTDKAASRAREK
ncbi:uncharacterized protein TNCT_634371 [Trichonephila clavata]|uniref:Uncharacterized protein n=1 Tax=Trichonephila clavata TaxID=2740835 RepID=A0A8X6H656_TRICU|nr:uncharacterized protein TNCT_634371 [Trichonephila clavata]